MSRGSWRAMTLIGATALIFGVTSMDEPSARNPSAVDPAPATASTAASSASTSATTASLADLGPTPAASEISFELILAFPGRVAMEAYALSVGDPSSGQYRRFLTADEIGERFGIGEEDLARIRRWAADHGVTAGPPSPQRISIAASAPARTIERLFGVTLTEFSDPSGRTFHAPTGDPSLPAALSGLVTAVDGLDTRPTERPAFSHPIAAGPDGGMKPSIIDRTYELEGLRTLGLHGEGQTVALVSLDTFDPADVRRFDGLAGISGPAVERIKVNGGVSRPGDGQDEVNLDIDVLRAVAPQARILDYELSLIHI